MIDAIGNKIEPGDIAIWSGPTRLNSLLACVVLDTYKQHYRSGDIVYKLRLASVREYAGFNDAIMGTVAIDVTNDRVVKLENVPKKLRKVLEQAYRVYIDTQGV